MECHSGPIGPSSCCTDLSDRSEGVKRLANTDLLSSISGVDGSLQPEGAGHCAEPGSKGVGSPAGRKSLVEHNSDFRILIQILPTGRAFARRIEARRSLISGL